MGVATAARAKRVKAKSRCCKDRPRCKRCPVVLKRLEAAGFAERDSKRWYVVELGVSKAAVKAARKR